MEKEEEYLKIGEKIYDNFCKEYGDISVVTPRTTTLKIFYLLSKKGYYDLLIREMMKEFLTNIDDYEIVVDNYNVFRVVDKFEII